MTRPTDGNILLGSNLALLEDASQRIQNETRFHVNYSFNFTKEVNGTEETRAAEIMMKVTNAGGATIALESLTLHEPDDVEFRCHLVVFSIETKLRYYGHIQ